MTKFCLTFYLRSFATLHKNFLWTAVCSLHLQPANSMECTGKVNREIKLSNTLPLSGVDK